MNSHKPGGPEKWLPKIIIGLTALLAVIVLVLLNRFGMIAFSLQPLRYPTPARLHPVEPAHTATKAPTPTLELPSETPAGAFSITVRKPASSDLTSGMPSIWNENGISVPDMPAPGKLAYSGAVRAEEEYLFSIFWCAKNMRRFNEDMASMKTSFYVNGHALPEDYILRYDYERDGWSCRSTVIALSGWIAGQTYILQAERNIFTKVSDGERNYPAGVYLYEVYLTAR